MYPKKLSLALRNDTEDRFPSHIPVSVFSHMIPEELDHIQATCAKAGNLVIPFAEIRNVVANFAPHIQYALPSTIENPPPITFTVTSPGPAHVRFETGYGELVVRCEEFLPLVEHMKNVVVEGVKIDEF